MNHEKRIIILLILLMTAVTAFCLVTDFNTYLKSSKTIPCGENGLILSITTFDGDSETQPFVKCMGHTWLSLDNQTGHTVTVRDHEVKNGEMLTFSVWAITDHRGVVYNLEPEFIRQYGRYAGRKSLSVNIEESDLKTIGDYIESNDEWRLGKNCSYWAIHLWNEVVGEEYRLKTQTLVYTPKRLLKSLTEFDCVETDKDFSRACGVFFDKNGRKTELELCS